MRKIVYPFAFVIILPILILLLFPETYVELQVFLFYQAIFLPLAIGIRNGILAMHHHPDMKFLRRLDSATKAFVFLEFALTCYIYVWFSTLAVGTKSFLVLSIVAMSLLASADNLAKILPQYAGDRVRPFFKNFMLATVSLGLAFIGVEFALQHSSINESIIIPEKWQKRPVNVAGSTHSYYWHGKLHVHDNSNIRRTTPFPPKNTERFRIIMVGDSLTYGYGIAEEDTYANLTEQALSREYSVEVLNLGVSGAQSEDIVNTVKRKVSLLNPDLVVYGACQNDFLPSGRGQYKNMQQYTVPLPSVFKNRILATTKTGWFLADRYDRLLRKYHFRDDFFDDILKGFDAYDARFRKDMEEMNKHVIKQCKTPVVAIVLDQYPVMGGKGYRISKIAEESFRAAGMNYIPMEEYYRTYSGKVMAVSQWEGHPNEEANLIFSRYITARIREDERLAEFRKR